MRLAKKIVALVALMMLALCFSVSAQTLRNPDDDRNFAPTINGGTGLFTVYDGQTLRRGEYMFSIAYSNRDRDPGNVDITEIPISFQVGINDYLELFFNTEAYRQIKVNSPRNLSGFYLPNSPQLIGGVFRSLPAVVLAPRGATTTAFNQGSVFRPQGNQPFVPFPYVGGSAGNFGFTGPGLTAGQVFGFTTSVPSLGPPRPGGNGADLFPGIGSPFGGILPGIVLAFQNLPVGPVGGPSNTAPTVFTAAPSYLPDAPLLNRSFGESAFNTFTVGAKWRWTGPNNPIGVGVVPFYRFYADKATSFGGFNQLQRGASPGGNRGDIGVLLFADSRLATWANVSANVSYTYNSSIKGDFPSGTFTLLDRPDEFTGAIALDFPVNKYFQPIGEFRTTKYVGGRTPNAFEQDPMDLLGGVRIFPARWFGMSFWYRYNVNQQDADIFDSDQTFTTTIAGNTTPVTTTVRGVPTGFQTSTDPHGFGAQFFIGRVNERTPPPKLNQYPTINSVDVDRTEYTIVLPCPPGQEPTGECRESNAIQVSTNATDPDGDQLVYQYTVTGGRITGSGANVGWDLSGVKPGTYTVSVMVDDGCGTCGQPKTREVVVKECQSCKPKIEIVCSEIRQVSASPDRVKVGETVTFTASVNTPTGGTEPTYNWSVSSGEIVSGQGSNTISVRTTNSGDLTATVELGNVDPSCPKTGSATALVEQPPISRLIDEYGVEKPNRSKNRLDQFAIELQNNPGSRGVIMAWGTGRNATRAAQRRLDFAIKYLVEIRGIERSRLTPINAGASSSGEWTQLWFVPAGAEDPTPQPR